MNYRILFLYINKKKILIKLILLKISFRENHSLFDKEETIMRCFITSHGVKVYR